MKPIHVCVPVLKRYDLLKEMLLSLARGNVRPDMVHVIDNGRRGALLSKALWTIGLPFDVYMPDKPMGVAAAWNSFIANVPEERVIVNDDVVFAPDSLGRLVASDADLIWAKGVGFSCFVLRDACVEKVGLFDAEISPGYGYYEDEDYLQRIDGHGTRAPIVRLDDVECGVRHVHSGTLKGCTREEVEEHHRKFKIAQNNYIKKWHLEEEFWKDEHLRKAVLVR